MVECPDLGNGHFPPKLSLLCVWGCCSKSHCCCSRWKEEAVTQGGQPNTHSIMHHHCTVPFRKHTHHSNIWTWLKDMYLTIFVPCFLFLVLRSSHRWFYSELSHVHYSQYMSVHVICINWVYTRNQQIIDRFDQISSNYIIW